MVAVIHAGRLQQYGTPHEVYARPANRMVADFMGLVNLLPGRLREVKNGGGTIDVAGGLTLDVARIDGIAAGDNVEVAIRPENIRHRGAGQRRSRRAPPSPTTFSSATSANTMRALPSGPTLRVQTHPLQRFAVGDQVAVEIDATQCSVFRRDAAITGYRTCPDAMIAGIQRELGV